MADREHKALRETLAREEARLAEISIERSRIERRIVDLKARLSSGSVPFTSQEKVALFLELFRGRTDVYARRWINTRKSTKGYSPACANEWMRGVCDPITSAVLPAT